MLREAINEVEIEGILLEVDTKYRSFVRDGKTVDAIAGSFKVLVEREEDGQIDTNEIQVNLFSAKYTKQGNINPAFESLDSLKDFTSVAAYGGKEGADKIRVRGSKIDMNAYYGHNGKLRNDIRIMASFVTRVTGEFKPHADFCVEGYISKMAPAVDNEGVEVSPKVLEVSMIVPGYNERVSEVPLVVKRPKVVTGIERSYKVGDSVKVAGKINFNLERTVITEEVTIGDPITKTVTKANKELEITSGYEPYDEENGFNSGEIREAVAKFKANLEETKNKPKKSAPAPAGQSTIDTGLDLGF